VRAMGAGADTLTGRSVMLSRRSFLAQSSIALAWSLVPSIRLAFAAIDRKEQFGIIGFAHATALAEKEAGALGGTLMSLAVAESGVTVAAATALEWSTADLKKYGPRLVDITSTERGSVLTTFRKVVGLPEIGVINEATAHLNALASVLVGETTLRMSNGQAFINQTAPALLSAVASPIVGSLLFNLSKRTNELDEVVAAFAANGSPIPLRVDAADAILMLPSAARQLLGEALNGQSLQVDVLTNLLTSKAKDIGVVLAADIASVKKAADDAVNLATQLKHADANLQTYQASLRLVAEISDSLGAKDLSRDLRNAATVIQQSYGVYQMVAAGSMGPIGALALLASGPSLVGGDAGASSSSMEQVMFSMILDELKEMRKEFRERLVVIDKKLDQVMTKLAETYEEVVKGNRTALKNFGDLRREVQGVMTAVEGISRENQVNAFRETLGSLVTAVQTNDEQRFPELISKVHHYAHNTSKLTYFVGKSFQTEPLRVTVSRYRSAELLIGAAGRVLDLTRSPPSVVDAANPIEWARGTMVYLEALQTMPSFGIPKVTTDLVSLWEDGKTIRDIIDRLSSSDAIRGAVFGFASSVAEPERWAVLLGYAPQSEGSMGPTAAPKTLQTTPTFDDTGRNSTDLEGRSEGGKTIRDIIGSLSDHKAISGAFLGLASSIAEPERLRALIERLPQNDGGMGSNASPKTLRSIIKVAMDDFNKKYRIETVRKPVPTRVVRAMLGSATIHDLFTSGRFYYDPALYNFKLNRAFRFDQEDHDPLLLAKKRGLIEITEVARWTPSGMVFDAPQLVSTWYTIKVLQGPDAGRIFGRTPELLGESSMHPGQNAGTALIKQMDARPDLNGDGNWWYWPRTAASDRFMDIDGLMDYCVSLNHFADRERVRSGLVNWLADERFKAEGLDAAEVFPRLFEFASALRICVSFAQWRLRLSEMDNNYARADGGTLASVALDNVDVPSSMPDLWPILQAVVNDVLEQEKSRYGEDISDKVAEEFALRLVNRNLPRYLKMPSQMRPNQSIPVVDATLRQLAITMASRGVKFEF
jgi:hypothetical protein